ncbi:MAG: hypothetical protein KDB95_10745, partial [Flavobacteriales bacterium]|nr:hypothetical protein [Flavobacteriales bacterium]
LAQVDENRNEWLTTYPNVEVFAQHFEVSEAMAKALQDQASKEEVEFSAEGWERSKELIELRLKALIARDLWDTSAYWQVINAVNPVDRSFQKAIEALSNDTFQRMGMAKQ